MAQAGAVKVYGLDEFARGARQLVGNIEDAAGPAFGTVAGQVAGSVRSAVPHLTGRLAGSVTGDSGGMFSEGAQVGMGGMGVPYAGWIEFGGSRGRAYVAEGRYLFPAAERADQTLQRAGDDACRHEIRTMMWPRPNKY